MCSFNSLSDVIQKCFNGAALNPGMAARHTLSGGLRISICMVRKDDNPDRFRLQLDRVGETPPSLEEWHTVLRNWPWWVDESAKPAKTIRSEGRTYLIGDVPPRVPAP